MKLSMSAQWEPVRYKLAFAQVNPIEGHGVGYAKRVIKREKDTMIWKECCVVVALTSRSFTRSLGIIYANPTEES